MTQYNTKQIYLTLRQFAKAHGFTSIDGIRWLIRIDREFVSTCVRKLGNRILLKESEVLKYIDNTKYTKNPKFINKSFGRPKSKVNHDLKPTCINKDKAKDGKPITLFEIVQQAKKRFENKPKQTKLTRLRTLK